MSLVPPIILPPPATVAAYALLPHIPTRQSASGRRVYSPDDEAAFLLEAFALSHSRVVSVSAAQPAVLAALACSSASPAMFTLRREWPARGEHGRVWVVYGTHAEASASLLLSPHVVPALESDLEPHAKLALLDFDAVLDGDIEGSKMDVAQRSRYTLPPAKISYRPGDWICTVPVCVAYNFARNMACIGCGHPHPYASTTPHALYHPPMHPHPQLPQHPPHQHQQQFISPRFADTQRTRRPLPPLPPLTTGRFASLPSTRSSSPTSHPFDPPHAFPSHAFPAHAFPALSQPLTPTHALTPSHPLTPTHAFPSHSQPLTPTHHGLTMNAKPLTPTYPLLTPSGHALSAGGRVRNISLDARAPCVMYWPDNEPLPERGQMRPSGSQVLQYPPIVNTGNKGAAEKQPGDWVCGKCHYLNWRRRKVCQTCYPYAEGNGDSISQAVQAERIALLTNLLNQTDGTTTTTQRRASAPFSSHSPSPSPFSSSPFAAPAGFTHAGFQTAPRHAAHPSLPTYAHRSRSQADLRGTYDAGQAIYQTPAYSRNSSPARSSSHHHPSSPFSSSSFHPSYSQEYAEFSNRALRSHSTHSSRDPSPSAPFLPACLSDVVHSPLYSSPTTSASSAELSFDDLYDAPAHTLPSSLHSLHSLHSSLRDGDEYEGEGEEEYGAGEAQFRAPGGATRSGRKPREESIWSLDGEESRTLRPYAPVQELAARLAGLATA